MKYSKKKLDSLIEEATVDCCTDDEAQAGVLTVLEESVEVPFATRLLGLPVKVTRVETNDGGEPVAVCEYDGKRQRVPLLDLPLPNPPPRGAEWIAAYRYWKSGKIE